MIRVRCRQRHGLLALLILLLTTAAVGSACADVLDEVQARGKLRCGVNGEVPGLSLRDGTAAWSGLDVDFCRAVAAAALGAADQVVFESIPSRERFAALREGRIDLLARNTSWTGRRSLAEGVSFAGILYFDGQGFMVPRAKGLRSALELDGATLCTIEGSTSIANAERYFTRHRMRMELVLHPDLKSALDDYLAGRCSALTTDQSQLHALRTTLAEPDAQRILPEVISKEPLAPAVRSSETRWLSLVRWTLYTLINAEELGITSANVVAAKERAASPEVLTLLDADGSTAALLGVEPGWGYRVLHQVGNYGELFDRNLGQGSALRIKRGLNALWNRGGLLYAPPMH